MNESFFENLRYALVSKETYNTSQKSRHCVKRDLIHSQKSPTIHNIPDKSYLATKLLGRVFENRYSVLSCFVVEENMRHWEDFF
jgi:hypothetical protein